MKPWEVNSAIGKEVVLVRPDDLVDRPGLLVICMSKAVCRLLKQCKNGLLQIEHERDIYTVPMTNVDLFGVSEAVKQI
jgi:hypothetical protein